MLAMKSLIGKMRSDYKKAKTGKTLGARQKRW